MKKILNWVLAATLVCGSSVFISCSNEDNPVSPIPEEKPLRVSKVYQTISVFSEMYDEETGEWEEFYKSYSGREVSKEIFWTGNRIVRVVSGSYTWNLTYDDNGRAVRANLVGKPGYDDVYEYQYDTAGRLVRSVLTVNEDDDIPYHSIVTTDYIYDGDKLKTIKASNNIQREEDKTPGTVKYEENDFTWQGDNVVSNTEYCEFYGHEPRTSTYFYEYTSLPNPFYYGSIVLNSLLLTNDIVDGLSKNFCKAYGLEGNKQEYHSITGSERVESYKSHSESLIQDKLTIYTDKFYEVEYLE